MGLADARSFCPQLQTELHKLSGGSVISRRPSQMGQALLSVGWEGWRRWIAS